MRTNLSHDAKVTLLPTADIGGTHTETAWLPMKDFQQLYAKVELGTWNATDDLDECRLEQAQDASGTGAKDLTSDAADGDYDTDTPVDAAGNFVILEATAEDLDVANGFNHVRLYVAEGGNTGVDNVTGVLIRHGYAYQGKQLDGAAIAGEKVYVRPS